MTVHNNRNVYKGRDSMRKYFDPDQQPFLPLVELPDVLNPFREDGVRIYAKLMTALPCQNVKALPALNMLQKAGPAAQKTIVEPSSGSTVTSMAMIARVLHGNTDVHAHVSNKTETSRLRTLQFFGLKVQVTLLVRNLYGGPAQPEILDPRGQIQKLRRLGENSPDIWNPGQYENLHNPESHLRWTGPQLLAQLPEINIFCAGMGSAGCITGTGSYLKAQKPSVTVVGLVTILNQSQGDQSADPSSVCNKVADAIPGPRPYPLFHNIAFPWKQVTDAVEEISSVESYRLSMALSREGLICGPSSGMALKGLLGFLQKQKDDGQLSHYADQETGEVSCVFLCCDLPYQYMDAYFTKLNSSDFHPIANQCLAEVDQGTYDPTWELSGSDAISLMGHCSLELCSLPAGTCGTSCQTTNKGQVRMLDVRRGEDFARSHLSGSISFPLQSVQPGTPSPFDDIEVLQAQYREIEALTTGLCSAYRLQGEKPGKVMILCYNGETGRLATSHMRRNGFGAYSVRNGFASLASECQRR